MLERDSPAYKLFIELIKNGTLLLDEKIRVEIKQFLTDSQSSIGLFNDRGGKPDLYYSLFGFLISSALDLKKELNFLKENIYNIKYPLTEPVDYLAHSLLQTALFSKKPSIIEILKIIFKKSYSANYAYKLFLFAILIDSFSIYKKYLKVPFRLFLSIYRLPKNPSCSILSALIYARFMLKMDVSSLQKKILLYFDEGKGFKVFKNTPEADLLSTAVALFALRKTNYDLRLVAPACLALVQNNYSEGAFLSGDGDVTRDIEYTFYGLLILGILKQ